MSIKRRAREMCVRDLRDWLAWLWLAFSGCGEGKENDDDDERWRRDEIAKSMQEEPHLSSKLFFQPDSHLTKKFSWTSADESHTKSDFSGIYPTWFTELDRIIRSMRKMCISELHFSFNHHQLAPSPTTFLRSSIHDDLFLLNCFVQLEAENRFASCCDAMNSNWNMARAP